VALSKICSQVRLSRDPHRCCSLPISLQNVTKVSSLCPPGFSVPTSLFDKWFSPRLSTQPTMIALGTGQSQVSRSNTEVPRLSSRMQTASDGVEPLRLRPTTTHTAVLRTRTRGRRATMEEPRGDTSMRLLWDHATPRHAQ